MSDALEKFKTRVLEELVPQYVTLPGCNMTPEGFKCDWEKIAERDASDFLRGLDAKLVVHVGHGKYRAERSHSVEKFFWESGKHLRPRPFGLWAEPIITVGALARLHFDLGWPAHLLGAQSKDYSFDLIACLSESGAAEHIACEVKKDRRELDQCIRLMTELGADPSIPEPKKSKPRRNAWKKVMGLRARRAPLFWALGPDRYEFIYNVRYEGDEILFDNTHFADLRYRPAT